MNLRLLALSFLALSSAVLATSVQGTDGVSVDVSAPKRVVALNATTVELIYRLGKQKTIVGTDITGTYPLNKIPSVGHWAQLPAEGIIALKPDVVIGTADNFAMPSNVKTVQQLRAAGVKVLVLPPSDSGGLDGVRTRLNMLAQVYGVPNAAASLSKSFDTTMQAVKANRPKTAPKVVFLYAHGAGSGMIYGTDGGANELITLAGGKNTATFKDTKALTAEALVAMNPDAIIMLSRGMEAVGNIDAVLKMPGVALTNAGRHRRIYAVDDSIRWIGPRLPEFALKLAREWTADFR